MQTELNYFTIRPAIEIGVVNHYILLPAFSYSGIIWKGASEVITQYNYSTTKNFVLRVLPVKPANPNYVPVISYRIGMNTVRYKLWEGVGERLAEPLYRGEVIKKNFKIEIWNIETSDTVSNDESITLVLSIRSVPSSMASSSNIENTTGVEVSAQSQQLVAPALPSTGLAFRYVYNEGITADPITQWDDQSGNGLHLTPVATGPDVVNNQSFAGLVIQDGIPHFDTTAKNLRRAGVSVQLRDLFIVIKAVSITGSKLVFDSANGGNEIKIKLEDLDNRVDFTYGGYNAELPLGSLTEFIIRLYVEEDGINFNFKAEISNIYGVIANGLIGTDISEIPALTTICIGSINGLTTADFWAMEVLGYDSFLDEDTAVAIKQYLANKYITGGFILPNQWNSGIPAGDN